MNKIYLCRHGQTVWNKEHRKQGQLDSPLTITGMVQALEMGQILEGTQEDFSKFTWIGSPLGRAKQSAALILEHLNLDWSCMTFNDYLMEHSFGEWEGHTDQEIESKWPGAIAERKLDWWNYRAHGGDSYNSLSQRVAIVLDSLNSDTVIVAHEMVSKVARGYYLRLSQEDILSLNHPQDTVYLLEDGAVKELKL